MLDTFIMYHCLKDASDLESGYPIQPVLICFEFSEDRASKNCATNMSHTVQLIFVSCSGSKPEVP